MGISRSLLHSCAWSHCITLKWSCLYPSWALALVFYEPRGNPLCSWAAHADRPLPFAFHLAYDWRHAHLHSFAISPLRPQESLHGQRRSNSAPSFMRACPCRVHACRHASARHCWCARVLHCIPQRHTSVSHSPVVALRVRCAPPLVHLFLRRPRDALLGRRCVEVTPHLALNCARVHTVCSRRGYCRSSQGPAVATCCLHACSCAHQTHACRTQRPSHIRRDHMYAS